MLEVSHLKTGYGSDKVIVHDVSFRLEKGEFECIIGANGCGKTAILKTILNLIDPMEGSVLLNGEDVFKLNERQRAARFAYIPQTHRLPFPFKVKDIVMMGRTPYLGRLASVSKADRRIVLAALCQLSIQHLADESYTELSGGQQQLVLIARALAQQPEVLVMDEPTASLDFGNQQLVLSRMRSLVDSGMSVLMVTHDPAHAFYCADRVVVFDKGYVLADGAPESVITAENMRTIYGTEVRIERVDIGQGEFGFVCVPVSQRTRRETPFLKELMRKDRLRST